MFTFTLDAFPIRLMKIDTELDSALSIIGGIAIGTLQKGETIYNAIMTIIPLSVCNGFLALFLCLMESIAAGAIVTRRVPANKPNQDLSSPPYHGTTRRENL